MTYALIDGIVYLSTEQMLTTKEYHMTNTVKTRAYKMREEAIANGIFEMDLRARAEFTKQLAKKYGFCCVSVTNEDEKHISFSTARKWGTI